MPRKIENIDQKKIQGLFEARTTRFLIPDYQRPYVWSNDECQTLWDDIYAFAVPDNGKFDIDNDDYFLGSIVVFMNDNNQLEVIDGQQRLITLLLLLRAFYEAMKSYTYEWSKDIRKVIGKCIWETDEQGYPDMSKPKIDSQVITDEGKTELMYILSSGILGSKFHSKYAMNYKLFQDNISVFMQNEDKNIPEVQRKFTNLPSRILGNCTLLEIRAGDQKAALQIFSTLNDRGRPLSDSDIFKVQLYRAFGKDEQSDVFSSKWKDLEEICSKIFPFPKNGSPLDELFNRYMHYERAIAGIADSTQEGLRAFYEKGKYTLLRDDGYKTVFDNLVMLADFWYSVVNQDKARFSQQVLKRLCVLSYAPNAIWTLIVSVYFIHNKKIDGMLDDEAFCSFLGKITGFIWAYTVEHSGVAHLRAPVYKEMISIVQNREVTFDSYKFNADKLRKELAEYKFTGKTRLTRSMLVWRIFSFPEQELLPSGIDFEIEHVHKQNKKISQAAYDSLGNLSLIEGTLKGISSKLNFSDKIDLYLGHLSSKRESTLIYELREIASANNDFTTRTISKRKQEIIESFISFIRENKLSK
ncbi:MAG: DUF262 domain-containing protein [Synergistaceae bacterium]|nr:DUF262 domain-containing protein [Synergistaceae bacterium]